MNQYKYSFRFTEKELREFCIRAVADLYRRRPAMWITLFVLCLAELFVVPVASAALLLLFLAAVILDVVRTFRFLKKEHFLERRIMWVEDGLLKCSAAGCSEIPCGRITVMRKTGSILMLGYPQSKRRLAWYPMPLRIFESGQELDAFLDQIRNSFFLFYGAGKVDLDIPGSRRSHQREDTGISPHRNAGDRDLWNSFCRRIRDLVFHDHRPYHSVPCRPLSSPAFHNADTVESGSGKKHKTEAEGGRCAE